MNLPPELSQKVQEISNRLGSSKTRQIREKLTDKYKSQSEASVIETKEESMVYALCRMPATYVVSFTLFRELFAEGKIRDVQSVIDVGTGTGSVYFALKSLDDKVRVTCFEREKHMSDLFAELSGERAVSLDIARESLPVKADLVTASYVFSELDESGKRSALKTMAEASNKYILIVDSGTPKNYVDFISLIAPARELGLKVIAPCVCEPCPLQNDYCQFYARVERTSVLRRAKSASESFEDEKYFYLLFEKTEKNDTELFPRVIRRPIYRPNMVELTLCTKTGVEKKIFTKRNSEMYKLTKKLKINEVVAGEKL